MALTVKTINEFNEIINNGSVCVVDLFATWCGPCRMLAPIIEKISNEANGRFVIVKVDVDELEDVAISYGVNTIPTLLYFKNGKLLEKSIGLISEETIINTIEKYL